MPVWLRGPCAHKLCQAELRGTRTAPFDSLQGGQSAATSRDHAMTRRSSRRHSCLRSPIATRSFIALMLPTMSEALVGVYFSSEARAGQALYR